MQVANDGTVAVWIYGDDLAGSLSRLTAEFRSIRQLHVPGVEDPVDTMSQETTADWSGDATTSNLSDLFDNGTTHNNGTLTNGGGATAILAEETIKIIYLIIG